jgi:hypothetical protein
MPQKKTVVKTDEITTKIAIPVHTKRQAYALSLELTGKEGTSLTGTMRISCCGQAREVACVGKANPDSEVVTLSSSCPNCRRTVRMWLTSLITM